MLYFLFGYEDSTDKSATSMKVGEYKDFSPVEHRVALSRHDFKTMGDAQAIASDATRLTGTLYIAIDNGEHVSPRYDVIEAPKVGDEISYAFNGDYYPCGKIAKISKSMHMITSDQGQKFFRRKETAKWVMGGTWTMVRGHRSERNPSF